MPIHLHRRHLLAGTGAVLSALALPHPARAAIAPFRRRLGAIELTVISDGVLNAPMSFALPETPAADAIALFAAHGHPPEWPQPQTNVSLIKIGNELVLIDAGSGSNFQPTAGKLAENMEAAGIDPATITKVVFSHCHPDHLWGAIDEFNDERFAKASYVVPALEWDFWLNPNTPDSLPEAFKGAALGNARILKRLEAKVERRNANDAVAPGLSYVETFGHTPGHMAVLVESEGQHLMIGGDVLTHGVVSFARPEWRTGADHDKDRGIATRRRLLDRLATDKHALVGFHLPWPGHGMVERSGTAFRFVPL